MLVHIFIVPKKIAPGGAKSDDFNKYAKPFVSYNCISLRFICQQKTPSGSFLLSSVMYLAQAYYNYTTKNSLREFLANFLRVSRIEA